MPQPSSVTRMQVAPPSSMATVMFLAPASKEFSTNSLMTEAGRSTTSPAAIMSATWGESILITGMALLLINYFLGNHIIHDYS